MNKMKEKLKKMFSALKDRKLGRKTFLAVYMMIFSFGMFASLNSDTVYAAQYKTKTFYLYNLGDNTTVQIKAIRDRDKYTVWGWNNTGASGSINVYNLGGGTWQVTLNNANVTSWTPYCYVTSSKTNYRPTGWTMGPSGGHGTAGYNGVEVHHEGDFYWTNNSCSFYIGAGFCRNSLTANWEVINTNWLTFDLQGGDFRSIDSYYQEIGAGKYQTSLPLTQGSDNFYTVVRPYRYGYKFLGYYDQKEGGELVYQQSTTSEDGAICVNGSYWNNYRYQKNQPLTVFAQWEKVSYDIEYDLNGGTMTEAVDKYDNSVYKILTSYNQSFGLATQDVANGISSTRYNKQIVLSNNGGDYWKLEYAGTRHDDMKMYYIKNCLTNSYLGFNGNAANGDYLYSYNSYEYQRCKWMLQENSNGTVTFIPILNGNVCLNAKNAATTTNSPVQFYPYYKDDKASEWILKEYQTGTNPSSSLFHNLDTNQFKVENPTKEGYIFTGWTVEGTDLNYHYSKSGTQAEVSYDEIIEQDAYSTGGISALKYIKAPSGFWVYACVTGSAANVSTQMPTWTDYKSQDDIKWYTMASGSWRIGNVTYNRRYFVYYSNHNNETQTYITHFYQYSNGSTGPAVAAGTFNPSVYRGFTNGEALSTFYCNQEENADCLANNIDRFVIKEYQNYFDIFITFTSFNKNLDVAVWTPYADQDDLTWDVFTPSTYEVDGKTYDYHIRTYFSKHNSEKDKYRIHFYDKSDSSHPYISAIYTVNASGGDYVQFKGDNYPNETARYKTTSVNYTNTDFTQTAEEDEEAQLFSGLRQSNGTVKLIANWMSIDYVVNFDADGGEGTMESQTMERNISTALNPNEFTRKGYQFYGWKKYGDSSQVVGLYMDQEKVLNLAEDKDEVTLYAEWTANNYKVTFNGNGSTAGSMEDQYFEYDLKDKLSQNKYAKNGYYFAGWNTKRDGTGVGYSDEQEVQNLTDVNNGTVTLYAQWVSDGTTIVNFDANGGSGTMNSQRFMINTGQNLSENKFTYKGRLFKYWNTRPDGTGTNYADKQLVTITDSTLKSLTLYAQWETISYKIRYHGNGATSGSMEDQSIKYDTDQSLTANSFEKKNSYFSGWNTMPDGSGVSYTDQQSVRNLSDINGTIINLYAQWNSYKYKIIFDSNGGEGNMPNQTFEFDVPQALTKNQFYKGTEIFKEWNTKSDGTGESYSDQEVILNLAEADGETIYLYAQWMEEGYKVKFDGNGATGGEMQDQLFAKGQYKNLSENQFVRTGYRFIGWNTNRDGTGTYYDNQELVHDLTDNDSIILYAQWVADKFTVTFDGNGATGGSMSTQSFTRDEEKALSANKFTKTGFEFQFWNTKPDGSGKTYMNEQVVKNLTEELNGNVTLYAQWSINTYTVTFNGNGAGGYMEPQSFVYNESQALHANEFSMDNFVFVEWNTKPDGSGTRYTDEQVVSNLTTTNGGNINLYAQWRAKEYTVKFNGNGSTSGSMSDQVFSYNESKALSTNAFKRTGYTFSGWNTEKDGSGKKYTNGQVVSNLVESGEITLYAQWTPNVYYIRFHGNGSTGGTMSEQMFTYDEPQTLNVNAFTKTGFTFSGWNTESNGSGYSYVNGQTILNLSAENGTTIDFYAQWSSNGFTVIFNGNGATSGSMSNQKFAYDETKPLSVNTFKRTGYTFDGWNTEKDGSGENFTDQQSVKNIVESGSVILYAQWTANKYSVVFNGNGATGGTMNSQAFTYDESKALSANVYTKTGYKFKGWNTQADGNGESYSNKEVVKNLTSTNGGKVTLYAQWTANNYTVKFDGNGATSGSMVIQSFTYDVSQALTPNAFKKTGYTFNGWNTSKDGSGQSYSNGESVRNLSSVNGATVTLYAQWTANTYTVKFDGNGAISGSMSEQNFVYDESQVLKANKFVKPGYTFVGWNTSKDGSGNNYSDQEEVKNLTSVNNGVVTLYAQWSANTFTVKFDGNGATGGTMSNQVFVYDQEKALTSNNYTKTGYTFSGWNTSKDGSGNSFTNGQIVSNLTTVNDRTVTLYAQWTANDYTVVFNGNGNTGGSMSSQSFTYNKSQSLKLNQFIKTGYTFVEWNTDPNGKGQSYSDGETVSNLTATDNEVITLYAQWSANTYTVVFDGNGATSGEMSDQTFTYDKQKPLTPNEYKKTGYTFSGWNTQPDGKGESYGDGETVGNLTADNKDVITLYAQWTVNSYTVVFDGNGATGGSMSDQIFSYDETKALTQNSYQKTGYTFAGWNTKADGSGTGYKDQEEVKKLTSTNNGIVTLYAQWDANHYTVVFDGNGKTSGTMSNQSFVYGQYQKLNKNTFQKTGFKFVGWNTKQDGSGQNYADQESVRNLTSVNGDTVILYAQWNECSYVVRFHGNGNTGGTMSDQTFTFSEVKKLLKNQYTNIGYRFIGWNTVKDGSGKTYEDEQVVSGLTDEDNGVINLYAQWTLNIDVSMDVSNEYYHVEDEVTVDDIKESLEVNIYDQTSEDDITESFDNEIVDKVIVKQIVDEANQVQDLNENLDTTDEGYYYVSYILMISDKYNPDNQVTEQVEQKIVVVEDVKGSEQQIPQVEPDGSGVSSEIQPIRYISKKYLNTLSENSKWKTDTVLNQKLVNSLNKEATDENAIYIIEMSKEDCRKIKEYICDGRVWDKNLNKDVLDEFGADIITKKP